MDNKEKKREYGRRYRENHKEHIKKYSHEYYYRDLEKSRAKGRIRQVKYRKTKGYHTTVNRRKAKVAITIMQFKKDKRCITCGEPDPRCLDFHHRNPFEKKMAIAQMVSNKYSIKTIMKEIEKCDLVCRNCHVKTYNRVRMYN